VFDLIERVHEASEIARQMSQNGCRVVRHDDERNPYKTLQTGPFLLDNPIGFEAGPVDMASHEDSQNTPPERI
jgi:hypothetical protein